MKLQFRKIHSDAIIPQYQTEGAVAFDFATYEDIQLRKGLNFIKTGLSINIPEGYVLVLAPRSSTYKKQGLRMANEIGIVDQDYNGPGDDIMFAYIADEDIFIEKGTRIGQGMILPVMRCDIQEGDWNSSDRGGFGSTGSK
ncbi:MAG: dUTP diphosphatase [Patescibacteria group bacterium]|nr:dUTP diphosphatase [Patescibacteria group bacterium]